MAKQVQVKKPAEKREQPDQDLRTPSGKKLPY